ncbi:unnamed protein product [Paramecium sonneborni]|uniref:Transmembrane protein n=1 Tax=Paramecium sonneborni TaxID=65129 RepID=A0A8S1R5K7_9CILI|nr:unnamed protein product [Paramecium sonneborni]
MNQLHFILLLELLILYLISLNKKIQAGYYEPIPSKYNSDLQDILKLLLQVDPNERPNCDQILKNPKVIKVSYQQKQNRMVLNKLNIINYQASNQFKIIKRQFTIIKILKQNEKISLIIKNQN